MAKQQPIQGSLFEEDFLLRTLGPLAYSAETALTELIANAWDAGASKVSLAIPNEHGQHLTVEDDGVGMTPEQFVERWMTLGYNRVRRQGLLAEFPPDRADWRRTAYGRNGIGRHGLLCFGDTYDVETRRDGKGGRFTVSTTSGDQPFCLTRQEAAEIPGHGTRLRVRVVRNLCDADKIRDVLSARFLHDPRFELVVNERSVPLAEHPGLIDRSELQVGEGIRLDVLFIDSAKTARTNQMQGVAFWVGNRLVGEPSWIVGGRVVIDGRTRLAKRHTVVVKTDDLFDHVLPDWSGFKSSDEMTGVLAAVAEHVTNVFLRLAAEDIEETKMEVLNDHRVEIAALRPLARFEVRAFVDELASRSIVVQPEIMDLALNAFIRLEQSRSGPALLEKLGKLSDEDIDGLDRLLSDWTVQDALRVLDEIDRRIATVEAIKKLSADEACEELRTLHPLITEARWVFGPEFDSPEFASNISIRNAVEKVFGDRIDRTAFLNPRKRPDLVVLADATLCAVGTEKFVDNGLATLQTVLLIELKRGRSTIGREEMNQATGYAQDLLTCGLLDGPPFIRAFVVGHACSGKISQTIAVGNPEAARIQAITYGQIVRTAEARLFKLRDRLQERYENMSGAELLQRASGIGTQLPLDLPEGVDSPSPDGSNGCSGTEADLST